MKHIHYGWVMVFCAMGILAVNSQTFYTFGLFLRELQLTFGWERGAISLAFSMMVLVANPLSILTGRLSDRIGPRLLLTLGSIINGTALLLMSRIGALWQMYVLFGLVLSVGNSMCIVPLTSTIARWFSRKREIALGLTYAGMTLGGIIGPIIVQWTIGESSWRWAYALLGVLMLGVQAPLALKLRREPAEIGLAPYGDHKTADSGPPATPPGASYREALASRRFWLLGLVYPCVFFVGQTVLAHIAPHATDIGLSKGFSASLLSIYAGSSMAGVNLSWLLSARMGVRRVLVVSLSMIVMALVWLVFSRSAPSLVLFVIVFGVGFGLQIPLQTVAPATLFGLRSLGAISATIFMLGALGGAVGSPLAGAIFDARGTYQLAFLIAIGMATVALGLSIALLRLRSGEMRNR